MIVEPFFRKRVLVSLSFAVPVIIEIKRAQGFLTGRLKSTDESRFHTIGICIFVRG